MGKSISRVMARCLVLPLLALTFVVSSATPSLADNHSGPYWAWEGPAKWTAAYGAYGITILGNRGAVLDLGFSSITCSPGGSWDESVANYFAGQRQSLASAGWQFTSVSAIAAPAGMSPTYRRQVVAGKIGRKRGVAAIDYDFTSNVSGLNYCYQRRLAKAANKRGLKASMRILNRAEATLAYSGPGA